MIQPYPTASSVVDPFQCLPLRCRPVSPKAKSFGAQNCNCQRASHAHSQQQSWAKDLQKIMKPVIIYENIWNALKYQCNEQRNYVQWLSRSSLIRGCKS